MENLLHFLETSYTAFHVTKNACDFLLSHGFEALNERDEWHLKKGGKYFVTRNESSFIAFTVGDGDNFKIIASHGDSCSLKLKEHPETGKEFTRLNVEPYGFALWYTFFDRPLKLAGRLLVEENGAVVSKPYTAEGTVVVPSVAVHLRSDLKESFAPDMQVDMLPLYALGEEKLSLPCLAHELYAVPATKPFYCGKNNEFVSSPRVDNLISVYASLQAIVNNPAGNCVAACFDNEEIGNRTFQGAQSDFLRRTLERIASFHGIEGANFTRSAVSSLLISLDNAHSIHPAHPEKSEINDYAVMGKGIAIKFHACGAYATTALTAAAARALFDRAGVKHQPYYNRSGMRSGITLGDCSITQIGIPTVDIGIPELAMHSACETFAVSDYEELLKGLNAFYKSNIKMQENGATFN